MKLLARGSRWLARHRLQDWLTITDGPPVLSVTFDDVNASACETGSALLEQQGCRGTFYVAGGLTDGVEQSRATHSAAQLGTLHAHGHELGCHGWSHRRSTALPSAELIGELERNRAFLKQLTGSDQPMDFAFPFGDYDYRTKRICGHAYRSCRITGGGMHRGRADLSLLGSYRLYGPDHEPARWRAFLGQLRPGNWAIVNTHGVEPDCGPYGATPDTLRELLARALEQGCLVLPVGQAIAHLRGRLGHEPEPL